MHPLHALRNGPRAAGRRPRPGRRAVRQPGQRRGGGGPARARAPAGRQRALRLGAGADVPRLRAAVLRAGGCRVEDQGHRHGRRGARLRHRRLPAREVQHGHRLAPRRREQRVHPESLAQDRQHAAGGAAEHAVELHDERLHPQLLARVVQLGGLGGLHRLDGAQRCARTNSSPPSLLSAADERAGGQGSTCSSA